MDKKKVVQSAALAIPTAALLLLGGSLVSYAQTNSGPAAEGARMGMELTEEQKSVLEQARELAESGDREGAKALLDAAGIQPPHHGKGQDGEGFGKGPHGNEEARAAVENNDYTAWKSAMSDHSNADQLTQDVFNKLVEAHGYMEQAREIMESLKDILGNPQHAPPAEN